MKEEVVHNPCGICSNTLDEGETVKLRAKGAYTINKASSERGTPSITVSEGQTVHLIAERSMSIRSQIEFLGSRRNVLKSLLFVLRHTTFVLQSIAFLWYKNLFGHKA